MSQPTRDDELKLFAALRAAPPSHHFYLNAAPHWEALGMSYKRAKYLLEKWSRKGWWDSRNDASGNFTAGAPSSLLAKSSAYDLTFNAPMSFPIVFAASTPAVQKRLLESLSPRSLIFDGMGQLTPETRKLNTYRAFEHDISAARGRGMTANIMRPIVQMDTDASAKAKAERVVSRWLREMDDPDSVSLDDRALDDLVDLVALQSHNNESLIVLTTNGASDPLDGAWLDDMLAHGPNGRGMSANWIIQAVYAQARILSSRSGATVRDAIGQAAAQLEAAARARAVWSKANEAQFASMRRVVENYVNRPRHDTRERLAELPRQSLAQSIHSLIEPDVQPVDSRKSAPAPAPIRRSWFARIRHALTHPYKEGMQS